MNWILKKREKQKRKEKQEKQQKQPGNEKPVAKRSEEITDIIDRMPMAFGRWVAIAVVVFASLLILFGWIIKYPDTVTGHIRINSGNAPVKLVANTSGNIHLEASKAQDEVIKGEYIAVIENSALTGDVQKIADLIKNFHPTEKPILNKQADFPEKVSLGELNMKYYAFLSALKNQCDYEKENIFEKRRISLNDDIRWKKEIEGEYEKLLTIIQQKLEISSKWFDKYASLNKDEIVTYEYELDRSKSEYLSGRQEEQTLQKDITSIRMQIAENQNQLKQLQVEQQEKERQLLLDLLASYHDLSDNIKAWEQKYVLKAPFDGRVEHLKFLTENQFIQAGEEVFGIIPKETNVFGQVLLPANGAGKVKLGSRVTVKLDNYPYMEYGSIEGWVSSISLLSQAQRTEQNTIETYLLIVDLPEGLTTNYGEILDFQYEIGGVADIIVKERRLIERLFDNLKYSTK
jgi:multidrug efflux pump subunit AcrA (membrane-fusion protein)